eukprot:10865749-Ditylum_brightwellii.AAC.1
MHCNECQCATEQQSSILKMQLKAFHELHDKVLVADCDHFLDDDQDIKHFVYSHFTTYVKNLFAYGLPSSSLV